MFCCHCQNNIYLSNIMLLLPTCMPLGAYSCIVCIYGYVEVYVLFGQHNDNFLTCVVFLQLHSHYKYFVTSFLNCQASNQPSLFNLKLAQFKCAQCSRRTLQFSPLSDKTGYLIYYPDIGERCDIIRFNMCSSAGYKPCIFQAGGKQNMTSPPS